MSRRRFAPLLVSLLGLGSAWAVGPAAAQGVAPGGVAPNLPPPPSESPPDAELYFIAPQDGAVVKGPVQVQFGLRGMGVTQAGSSARNAGHHHLLVDVKVPLDARLVIPADKSHLHFGGGETETSLDLAPGRHTLQLVLGDGLHRPFLPIVASRVITITVEAPAPRRRPRRRF